MSSIYIQEPPTHGKVLLKTTAGDLDIELWSKEAPLACRNFVQLCMEGYYNNVIFHRLVKGFIVQGGDPTGTGMGGESIYGSNFKDEFHSRLRFMRRGLVAMANSGQKDDNGSQFFITLDATPELQNVHTIFGKVSGKTLFNLPTLGEGEVDRNDCPIYPHKIISTEILSNPFDDIVPRVTEKKAPKKSKEEKARSNVKANKNFTLLSFGDEAEEEEEEVVKVSKEFKTKSKSSHDLLKDDKNLSSVPVVEIEELDFIPGDISSKPSCSKNNDQTNNSESKNDRLNVIKTKLQPLSKTNKKSNKIYDNDNEDDDFDILDVEHKAKKQAKIDSAREEFNKLKAEMLKQKKKRNHSNSDNDNEHNESRTKTTPTDEAIDSYKLELKKFKHTKKSSDDRSNKTWEAVQQFRKKLENFNKTKNNKNTEDNTEDNMDQNSEQHEKMSFFESCLNHKMVSTGDDEIVLARDANIRNEEEWYDIYDPRNSINKRRRKEK